MNGREVQLSKAVLENNFKTVQTLLEQKTSQKPDGDGNTPLHLAAKNGFSEIVSLLLTHGADRSAKNQKELTPILTTLPRWKLLGQSGYAVIKEFAKYPDTEDRGLYSVLITHLTKEKEDTDLIMTVLKAGTKPISHFVTDEPGSECCYSEMGWSIRNEQLELFKEFLKHGYNPYALGSGYQYRDSEGVRKGVSVFKLALLLKKNEFAKACIEINPEKAKPIMTKVLIRELEEYIDTAPVLWGGHGQSAEALVKDLKMGSNDFTQVQKILEAAVKPFKPNQVIVIHQNTPKYALPKKSKKADEYTKILKNYEEFFGALSIKPAVEEEKAKGIPAKATALAKNNFLAEESRRHQEPNEPISPNIDFMDERLNEKPPGNYNRC